MWTKTLFFEILILLACPIPYYDHYVKIIGKDNITVTYFLSEIFLAFMLLRLYFFLRTLFNQSIYSDAIFKKLCRSYGFQSDLRFSLKCQVVSDPEVTILAFLVSTVLIFAYLARIFEMPYYRMKNDPVMDSYFNAIYMTTITLTTVGYGDLAPCTWPGRLVIMFIGTVGAFYISLLVIVLDSILKLNP